MLVPARRWTLRDLLAVTMVAALMPGLRANAQEAGGRQGWTPALQLQYRAIQGTAISPDGRLIAYVVRTPLIEGEQSEYLSHIWLASADGARDSQFTRGEASTGSPRFSPDGSMLAFTSSRSDTSQVWVMPVGGGEAWRVTGAAEGVGSFAWSPDGSSIAYTMRDPDSEAVAAAKKEKRWVERVDQDYKYAHLYVVDVGDGGGQPGEATRLTEGDFHVSSFDWSPDGQHIAFSHAPDPRINTNFIISDISLVGVPDGEVTPLVTLAGVERSPRFSPDGRWIAFVGTGEQPEPIGLGDVWLVSPRGGQPFQLANTPNRSANILGWTSDGRTVLVSEAVGTAQHVIGVPSTGDPARILTQGDGVHRGVSVAAGTDRIAFTYENTELAPDVYVAEIETYARSRVTDVHADVPRPQMGRTELLRWESDDGTPVEGLLTYPVDYEEGRLYPMVLNVHGGPAGAFSRSFTGAASAYMLQTFAQQGYAILRPNPRGSTGYGKDFRYANVKDWGYGDLEDLLAGVDEVVDMQVAHVDSLLLMGWSYGGYMTSFAVTRTDRFRAASMGAGLPNLISMVTTTDIQDYLVGHMEGEFWEDFDTYEKHSAIYRIREVTTPTQVIHGENDLRVPFTQGQEFYRALARRGVETEMIVLPRTPHGPREPKLQVAVTEVILEWFEKHLERQKPKVAADGGT